LIDAFKSADDVLYQATKGISDLISVHGLVNLDFADVQTIMKGMGDALMGTGFAEGENRAVMAADSAIHSPLLDDVSISGAKGILINITGGEDMTLYDVSDATQAVYDAVGEDSETNVIFGAVTDQSMNGKISVTVIATGFNEASMERSKDVRELKMKMPVNEKRTGSDKSVKQITMDLSATKEKEKAAPSKTLEVEVENNESTTETDKSQKEEFAPETVKMSVIETKKKDTFEDKVSVSESNCIKNSDVLISSNTNVGLPPYMKANQKGRQEQGRVFVSKGSVITHYEDDMDVPTFLRKQMQ
jgi:cell division protein FtsZ